MTKKFNAVFNSSKNQIGAVFNSGKSQIGADFGEITKVTEYVGGEPYDGEYTVTPKVEAQTLPTKEKVMLDDVTVKAIPFFNVSNTSGGSTVYIGSEV